MPPDAAGGLPPVVAVVLAAQRAGQVNPLAAEADVSHKCLVPIAGRPLIAHVVAALRAVPGLARLRIVIEPEVVAAVQDVLPRGGVAPEFVAAADNLADSVLAAARDLDQPVLVTTADNVLLTPDAVAAMRAALAGGAEVAVGFATREAVLAAHPEGQRRFYRFTDGEYCNCNLYAFAGARALAAAETFRSGGQFAKKPLRLVATVGPLNIALFLLGRLSLRGALARVGRRFRLDVEPVVLPDGSHAVDVDNRRTYDIAATLLARRAAEARVGVAAA